MIACRSSRDDYFRLAAGPDANLSQPAKQAFGA
jgi:hypothetical protein